tara:strand:- start:1637 stop:2482 length:846 start_codon:yes stop_codon:yes gene_type:complete
MKIIEYNNFKAQPLAGALGAEILDIDLNKINDSIFEEIYKAFVDYQVIGIPNQNLTPDEYLAFGRRWGEIHHYPYMKGLESHPEILEILKTETDTYAFGNVWHSDGSFTEIPPKATMLYAQELPPAGGDTLFADMYQAYDTLSDKMKNILGSVNGLYVGDQPLKLGNFSGAKSMKQQDPGKTKVHTHHPIIRMHPDSKNKALYIGGHAVEIEGMTKEESTPILNYLKAHSTRPEFICRFKWSPGAIAIWDNRCTQHYAVDDYSGFRRRMHRITILGEEAPY